MPTQSTLTKEHLDALSNEEIEAKKADLEKELREEQDLQHELMMQVQSKSLNQALSGIKIPRPTTGIKNDPQVQTQPSQQKQEGPANMSALAVATAHYLKQKSQSKKESPTTAQRLTEVTQKLGTGRVVNSLVKDSKKQIKTLIDPDSSPKAVTEAARALQDNITTINQTLNTQIKDLQYADKKTFDKAQRNLTKDVENIKSLGDDISKHAAKLETRNAELSDDLKVEFHSLGDNIKETAHSIGKAIQEIANKLNPQSLGLKVGS